MPVSPKPGPTRRDVLASTAAASLAAFLPIGRSPRLRVACFGVGGMGSHDLGSVASAPDVDIVALCDVDSLRLHAAAKRFPKARTFADWRAVLELMGRDIDAVVVSTPDHMHGPIALAAMDLGKHAYVQKPLAHNIAECRAMAAMSERRGVVTQMGTQIHGESAYRSAVATLREGAIGRVREAWLWVSKSWAGPAEGRGDRSDRVPASVSWDLWLGVADERPFVSGAYHPARWRGWRDFGSGTLGDMGCHLFDPVFTALELGSPTTITAHGPALHAETFSGDGRVDYVFPGTRFTAPTMTFHWRDGPDGPPHDVAAELLPEGTSLPPAGSLLVGETGAMVIPHWAPPTVVRDRVVDESAVITVPSVNHYHEWVDACLGRGDATTPFTFSGPATEAVLLGTLATIDPGTTMTWDTDAMTLHHAQANAHVRRRYREGWTPVGI